MPLVFCPFWFPVVRKPHATFLPNGWVDLDTEKKSASEFFSEVLTQKPHSLRTHHAVRPERTDLRFCYLGHSGTLSSASRPILLPGGWIDLNAEMRSASELFSEALTKKPHSLGTLDTIRLDPTVLRLYEACRLRTRVWPRRARMRR